MSIEIQDRIFGTYISTYYKISDFACKCGCGYAIIDQRIPEILDEITTLTGVQLYVTSGCRCNSHNKAEGGEKNSLHTNTKYRGRALAVDIWLGNMTIRERFDVVHHFMRNFNGVGIMKSYTTTKNNVIITIRT